MDFTGLKDYLETLQGAGVPGCDIAVYRDHELVFRHYTGWRDREAEIPMDGTELYWIFSASKVHTATAAMQLIEQGKIGLDDPVSQYLPAYRTLSIIENGHVRAPRTEMTIRHLMSMQGGLNYDIQSPSIMKTKLYSGNQADTQTLVNAFAEEPLSFDPGAHYQYSLCHDVLAAVIEVASGMKFSEYLRKNIWEPLGITDTGFTIPEEKKSRLAQQYNYDNANHTSAILEGGNMNVYQLTPNYESGGAGLYSCVNDYARLTDALACGGVGLTGKRILKSETIDLMRTNQQHGQCLKDFQDNVHRYGYGYGLGVRTLIDEGFTKSPIGEFGWDGAACAYTLSDPANRVSAYFAMHVRSCLYGYLTIHPTIRDLIYEGLKK